MSSASSYLKPKRNYQLWKKELGILISKIPDNVATLAGGALDRHIQKPRETTNFATMSSASSYPKTQAKVPTLAGLALHLHMQKPRQSTNYGRMSCISSYQKIPNKVSALYLHIQKPRKSTNFGKMFSASSYPKIETKDQLWQDELVIFVSKNSNKVPTLVGCALHRHIQKSRESINFGGMLSASSYPKTKIKYQNGRMSS